MGIINKIKKTFKKEEPNISNEVRNELRSSASKLAEETPKEPKTKEEPKATIQPDTKESMESDPKKKPIIEKIKTIEDPELGIDIWTLGLIYNIEVENNKVNIRMTFTSIMCPVGPTIIESVKNKLTDYKVSVEVVFDPPWEPTEELREMLGV